MSASKVTNKNLLESNGDGVVDQDIKMVSNWKPVGEKGSWRGYIQFAKDSSESRFKETSDKEDEYSATWYNPFSWF